MARPYILHLRVDPEPGRESASEPRRALADFCRRTTPSWELASSGAFLDLSGMDRLYGPGMDGAARVGSLARGAAGILGGGAAPTRLAARLASLTAARAGGGILGVVPDQVSVFLSPFPIKFLPGQTSFVHRLLHLGVRTLGDLQVVPPALLQSVFGAGASRLADEAWGRQGVSSLDWEEGKGPNRGSLVLVVGLRLARPALSESVTAAMLRGLAVRALTMCPGGPVGGGRWRLTAFRRAGRPDEAYLRGRDHAGWKSWLGLIDTLWSRLPVRRKGVLGLELGAETPTATAPPQGHLFWADEADRRLAEAMRRCRGPSGHGLGLASEDLLRGLGAKWYGPGEGRSPSGKGFG